MKRIFQHLPKKLLALVTGLVLVTGLAAPAIASFGPDRPTKAWSSGIAGFDHVTFNSFTGVGNGIGDERDFMRGVQVGRDSVWSDPVSNVTQDSEVEAKIYIHNNADGALNDQPGNPGVAKNVTVRVAIPTGTKQTQEVTSYIAADNAQPKEIFDTLDINGANSGFFGLQYEPGTAKLHEQNGTSTTLTSAQENALIGSGYNLGDQKGCFDFVKEITFKMKVQMPQYNLQKQVRFAGQGPNDWKESVNAKDGDLLEWSISFKNIGKTQLNNVAIVDQVPVGLDVVPGSVTLYATDFPDGTTDLKPNPIQANGRQLNINIGNYRPLNQSELSAGDISAQIIFKTKVNVAAMTTCGANTVVNKAFATPEGFGAISDTAQALVNKECQTPPPKTPPTTPPVATPTKLVDTGPGSVAGLFAGVTVAGALVHRLYVNRKLARA